MSFRLPQDANSHKVKILRGKLTIASVALPLQPTLGRGLSPVGQANEDSGSVYGEGGLNHRSRALFATRVLGLGPFVLAGKRSPLLSLARVGS
jgi:hypothetical protein